MNRQFPGYFYAFLLALLAMLLYVAGCSVATRAPQQPHVGYGGPDKALSVTTVAFVGDTLTYGWLQSVQAQHPSWINDTTNTAETTASMMARFQTVLDQHPDALVLTAGQGDVIQSDEDGAWLPPCGDIGTCSNIAAMVAQAHAAGIYVILGTTPLVYEPEFQEEEDVNLLDQQLDAQYAAGGFPGANALVDYENSFPPEFADDGNLDDPTAIASLEAASMKAIEACGCGGVR
jgi:hypothetical protein